MSLPWESVATGGKRIAAPVCGLAGNDTAAAGILARNDRARCKIPSILPVHPAGIVRKNTYFGNYGGSLSKIAGPQTADSSGNVVLRRTVVQINKNSGESTCNSVRGYLHFPIDFIVANR